MPTDPQESNETQIQSQLPADDKSIAKTTPVATVADTEMDSETDLELVASSASMQFKGPLPPPGFLAGYEEITPGAADRIIRLTEEEALHRRAMEE